MPRTIQELDLADEDPAASARGLSVKVSPFSPHSPRGRHVDERRLEPSPHDVIDVDAVASRRGVEPAVCLCVAALTCVAACDADAKGTCRMQEETGRCACHEYSVAMSKCGGCGPRHLLEELGSA